MSFWFVSVVPKYLNFATFWNDSLAVLIFWFCSEFGWQDIIIYFVFSAFISRSVSLLASESVSEFPFMVYDTYFTLIATANEPAGPPKFGIDVDKKHS
jgi:hypothetical protein